MKGNNNDQNDILILDDDRPFPGPLSYGEENKDYFFGREKEVKKLIDKILTNRVTVIYGKSGIGKTSLVQAGLFPELRNHYYLPIHVQIPIDQSSQLTPIKQVKSIIENEVKKVDATAKSMDDLTLWEYFSQVKILNGIVNPVLVIDHFEEIFKIGKFEPILMTDFVTELGDLVQNWIPSYNTSDERRKKNLAHYKNYPEYRVLICLREDYFPNLNNLRKAMPDILNGHFHFRLLEMSIESSLHAIYQAGAAILDKKNAEKIIDKFPRSKRDDFIPDLLEDEKIDPFLLNLYCFQLNEKRIEKGEGWISEDLIKSTEIGDIVGNYYEEIVSKLPDDQRDYLENSIINDDRKRSLCDISDFKMKIGINADTIKRLIKTRIFRRLPIQDGSYLQLSHDVFIDKIVEIRKKKELEEKNKKQEKQIEMKDQELKKKIHSLKRAFVFISILILISAVFYKLYKSSEFNRLGAEALLELPKDNTKALKIVDIAYKKGLPTPPARISQILTQIGYSSADRPFYTLRINNVDSISSIGISKEGNYILTASKDGSAKIWSNKGKLLSDKIRHHKRILSVEFSPESNSVLTSSLDKTAAIWDLQGNLKVTLNGHKGPVDSATFSPDGSRVLTASRDGTAKLWDLTSHLITTFKGHTKAVFSATFSHDGKFILTSSWDKRAIIWNIKGGKIKEFPHNNTQTPASFSPSNNTVLTLSDRNSAILWNPDRSTQIEYKHNKPIIFTAFSSDGKIVLTAAKEGECKIWDVIGKIINTIAFNFSIKEATISPDGCLLMAMSEKGDIAIKKLDGTLVRKFKYSTNLTGGINAAMFLPNSKQILTSSNNGTTKIWELKNEILTNIVGISKIVSAEFTHDGNHIITASKKKITLYSINGKILWERKYKDNVQLGKISPDNNKIVLVFEKGDVVTESLKGVPLLSMTSSKISWADFSSDSKYLLTTSPFSVSIWDIEGKTQIGIINHEKHILFANFSPNGEMLVTASLDGNAKLLDITNNIETLLSHEIPVKKALFAHKGNSILTISDDNVLRLWNLKGKLLYSLKHKDIISDISYSEKNNIAITAGERNIYICKIGRYRAEIIMDFVAHSFRINSVQLSTKGENFVSASDDETAKYWDLRGNLLANLNRNEAPIQLATVSTDNKRILTFSKEKKVKIWMTPHELFKWIKQKKNEDDYFNYK